MRFVNELFPLLSDDPDQLEKFIDQIQHLDDNTLTTKQLGTVILAPAATDVVFDFGGVTAAKYVIVLATDDVDVKLNGIGNTATPVKKLPAVVSNALSQFQKADQKGQLFAGPTNVTSVHLTNPSATDTATVFVAVIGEAS